MSLTATSYKNHIDDCVYLQKQFQNEKHFLDFAIYHYFLRKIQ